MRADLLEVVSVTGPDGYCPTNDCDTRTVLAQIPVPANARVVEAISEVQAPAKEAPFACGGARR